MLRDGSILAGFGGGAPPWQGVGDADFPAVTERQFKGRGNRVVASASCKSSISLLQAGRRTVSRVVSFLLCGVGAQLALPRTFFPGCPCALLKNPEPVRVLS